MMVNKMKTTEELIKEMREFTAYVEGVHKLFEMIMNDPNINIEDKQRIVDITIKVIDSKK